MRGGDYYYGNGYLYSQSSNGRYWSRSLDNATPGFNLYFYSGGVVPQYGSDRGDGFLLRCLHARKQAYTTPILAPLSLVRGGYYYNTNGAINSQFTSGYYWLRQAETATHGYDLGFNSGYIRPQYFYYRSSGFALRCVGR